MRFEVFCHVKGWVQTIHWQMIFFQFVGAVTYYYIIIPIWGVWAIYIEGKVISYILKCVQDLFIYALLHKNIMTNWSGLLHLHFVWKGSFLSIRFPIYLPDFELFNRKCHTNIKAASFIASERTGSFVGVNELLCLIVKLQQNDEDEWYNSRFNNL